MGALTLSVCSHRKTAIERELDAKELIMLLPNLLNTCAAAIPPVENIVNCARTKIANNVMQDGRISGKALEENQYAAHGLAWFATYLLSLQQVQGWAERLEADSKFGELEKLI